MGNSLPGKPIEEKMLAALFICTSIPNELLQMQKPEWNENIAKPLVQKLTLAGIDVTTIFPFNHELSEEIDLEAFNASMLIQPNVFVRIRPGKLALVKEKLTASQIAFSEINESCFAFANGVKLDTVLGINKEVIIQDLNSQRVSEMLDELPKKELLKVWDCCAASGGKSMMAYDTFAHIQLTVSDIRKSIIRNLHKRFEEAGIHAFTSFVADVANAESLHSTLAGTLFNLVICDAPCSGSGTWSRTPEQLFFSKEEEILRYATLQKRIAANAAKYVEKGGWFLYITCSVFAKENEDAVKFIEENTSLKLSRLSLLKGYEMKSDSMFAALFQNSD